MSTPPDTLRKLHALATHPTTPPHEAEQAWKALRRLLEKHGLTEGDLSANAKILQSWLVKSGAHKDLAQYVLWEILDCTPGLRVFRTSIRGRYRLEINLTHVDWLDFRACFSWYVFMLDDDMAAARRAISKLRKQFKDDMLIARATLANVPDAFLNKYKIGHAAILKMCAANKKNAGGTGALPGVPKKTKKLTKRQLAKQAADLEGWSNAANNLKDGSRWQKGQGLDGAELFQLEG